MTHPDQSALLSNVLDAATEVSIIATDPHGVITVFNRGAELLLGYSAEQLVSKHTPALFHLASEIAVRGLKLSQEYGFPIEGFRVFVQNAELHGREQRQWTYVCADGRQVQVSLIITVMRSLEGNITGYLGMAHDITKEIQAYKVVKEFKNMLDQVHDGIFMFRPDTLGFTYANLGATIQLGYNSEELLQMSPLDIKPEFTEAGFRERLRPLLDGEKTLVIFETVHRCKNGDIISVEVSIQLVSEQGQEPLFVNVVRDITERKAAERVMHENAQYTQAILDNIIDGIITIDSRGTVQSINLAGENIFGYTADEIVGRNVNMLMPEPHHSKHDCYLQNYHATGIPRIIGSGREVEGLHKDGTIFPIDLAVSQSIHQGQPLFIGVVRDITERKRVDLMKTEFVSTVSHELRTPLTSISGALGLIVGGALGELPEQAKVMLDIAFKNSKRLALLINDLLDMEKLAAGKMQLDLQLQLLMPLVEQTLEAVRFYGDQYQVRFKLIERADDVQVRVDSGRLQQVLTNFLSNAAKFSPSGAQVEVAVRLQKDVVQVEVIDHGPGISDEFRSRIFQKFSQADSSDTRQKGGTGLGLAISKELIERMNGLIGFDSEEGRGACFHFQLPVWRKQKITQQLPDTSMSGKPRLLVVEDDPNIASLLSIILNRAGYQVDVAANGETALNCLAHNEYVAMTLDLMLPDQSGVSLIRRIRSQAATETLPIIIVSAYTEDGKLTLNGDFNAIAWIDKPIQEEQLITTLSRFVPIQSANKPKILHVEDDIDLQHVVATIGRDVADFDVANNLAEARSKLARERYNLVVLDIGLPDGSGWELLADLKRLNTKPPVMVLSGSEMTEEQQDHVQAALLKTRIPNQDLLDTLKRLLPGNA
ncbi:PAS domain S-box protein [Methylobacter sp.]|uniref:PAS domain S-box protein n=1 Tax=Methylobacter sp. TaxID=2051955 RepID=UPI001211A461|nr:PAS domain S-box protein [Methylobacter sp.]TAK63289.1 MAG: PAS domain S-box protein [Methylobacter sp.]